MFAKSLRIGWRIFVDRDRISGIKNSARGPLIKRLVPIANATEGKDENGDGQNAEGT